MGAMIDALHVLEELRKAGFGLVTGVPCSYLTPLIDAVIASPDIEYVGAVNEGDAIAIACGARLAGRNAVVMFQNSGLGNAVNPLTSLTATFRIPVLVVTTLRGDPEGAGDEPQHELMGRITRDMLALMEIPHELLPTDRAELAAALGRAREHMATTGLPYGLVVKKGSVAPADLEAPQLAPPTVEGEHGPGPSGPRIPPDQALAAIRRAVAETDALLTTTGFTGRALYAQGDRPNQLYMVGSMGCISSLGLGLAKCRPDKRVVVVDGDGALLMRLGALATIGFERPKNLVHVLLDNGVHDSTGAQATVAPFLDLCGMARAAGYPRTRGVASVEELEATVREASGQLTFLHARTEPRADRKLPRPAEKPPEIAERFRAWLASS